MKYDNLKIIKDIKSTFIEIINELSSSEFRYISFIPVLEKVQSLELDIAKLNSLKMLIIDMIESFRHTDEVIDSTVLNEIQKSISNSNKKVMTNSTPYNENIITKRISRIWNSILGIEYYLQKSRLHRK
jgi:hypothetical protein